MKKLFIAVLAVAGLASCMQDEVLSQDQAAIEFGDAFVDNATKAIYDDKNYVKAFKVWGTVTGEDNTTVALYEGANVKDTAAEGVKNYGAAWTCDVTRFWTPNCDYAFYAVAHGTVTATNGVPTSIAYEVSEVEPIDLLYGETTKTTKDDLAVPEDGALVKFNMQHLLSRVKVSFTNAVKQEEASPYTYTISNVEIKTWKQGTYTVNAATPWTRLSDGDATLTFTNPANAVAKGATVSAGGAQLVIPGADVVVSFDYELNFNGAVIYSDTVSGSVNGLEAGHSYNITATLNLNNEIQFTVDDETNLGWGTDTTTPIQ